MNSPLTIPSRLLRPIQAFLKKEQQTLEKRKKDLKEEDPFSVSDRLTDNAVDTDAAEQFGHARIEALRNQIDKRLIEIRKALTRINIGKYGTCENCRQLIDTDRLTIYPSATLCIKCERKAEKKKSE